MKIWLIYWKLNGWQTFLNRCFKSVNVFCFKKNWSNNEINRMELFEYIWIQFMYRYNTCTLLLFFDFSYIFLWRSIIFSNYVCLFFIITLQIFTLLMFIHLCDILLLLQYHFFSFSYSRKVLLFSWRKNAYGFSGIYF